MFSSLIIPPTAFLFGFIFGIANLVKHKAYNYFSSPEDEPFVAINKKDFLKA